MSVIVANTILSALCYGHCVDSSLQYLLFLPFASFPFFAFSLVAFFGVFCKDINLCWTGDRKGSARKTGQELICETSGRARTQILQMWYYVYISIFIYSIVYIQIKHGKFSNNLILICETSGGKKATHQILFSIFKQIIISKKVKP